MYIHSNYDHYISKSSESYVKLSTYTYTYFVICAPCILFMTLLIPGQLFQFWFFFQHCLFDIKDSQEVPVSVTTTVGIMRRLDWTFNYTLLYHFLGNCILHLQPVVSPLYIPLYIYLIITVMPHFSLLYHTTLHSCNLRLYNWLN